MKDFFPFRLYATMQPYGVCSPEHFKQTWLNIRPKDLSGYAFDVIVNSRTEITFVIRDMHCPVFGGIGKEISHLRAKVSPALTRACIAERAGVFAQRRRNKELRQKEEVLLRQYTQEILRSL